MLMILNIFEELKGLLIQNLQKLKLILLRKRTNLLGCKVNLSDK